MSSINEGRREMKVGAQTKETVCSQGQVAFSVSACFPYWTGPADVSGKPAVSGIVLSSLHMSLFVFLVTNCNPFYDHKTGALGVNNLSMSIHKVLELISAVLGPKSPN